MRSTLDVTHPFGAALAVKRFTWPSGLSLLFLRDPAAPIVSFQTWLRVGSSHEVAGQTGMAHFFEHLMFNATQRRVQGEFDRLIEGTGGDTNAATWVDWTFYRDTVPAAALGLVVELEADRLQHLSLADEQIESEREVVTNERLERVEDDVDGFLDEQLFALVFTRHPYGWPTIGWMDDIRRLARPDIERFYQTYYAPNNLTLVMVGDVAEETALALIDRHYGDIPATVVPTRPQVLEPAQTEERRLRFTKPVPTPRLVVGYRGPGQGDPDWPVLDFIASVLGDGPSARLYRRLIIDTELASSVDVGMTPCRDLSLLRIGVSLTRDSDPEAALAEIDAACAALAATTLPAAELDKVKQCAETHFFSALVSCDGKAEQLGHYETTLGDFRQLFTMADRLAAITAADVARVARAYLVPTQRSVCVAMPGEEEA